MSVILKKGSKGNRVIELQKLLDQKGFWTYHKITNYFGDITETAVEKFQKSSGLKVDGIVGPRTWKALAKEKSKVKPIYKSEDQREDLSDPEEEMFVDNVLEAQPTSPKITEVINLIAEATITRNVNKLIYHCTATQQSATVEAILRYWKNNLGWKNPGYHIIIKPDGSWTQLQDFNRLSNGVAGINSTSIHVSYIGGIDKNGKALDNRTEEQKEVQEAIYWAFKDKMPELEFHGHYEFSSKACPSFKVDKWIADIREEAKLEI